MTPRRQPGPYNVEDFDVRSVDRSEVLRYLGYSGQRMTPELEDRIDEVVERCLQIARCRGVWRVFDVSGRETRGDGTFVVRLDGTALELSGESMREYLGESGDAATGAVAVGVMAVTVGMDVERELRRLSLTDPAAHVIFDAAGTTTVERAADACEASLVAEAARRGLHTGYRFSPGYGDLPLTVQPVLLDATDARRRLGITLSPQLLMTPTKSVTAIVGMYKEPQATGHEKGLCRDCACNDFCKLRPCRRH